MPALFGFTTGRSRGCGRERRHRNVKLQIEELERRELLSTYFVSPSGNDNNPGTSATAPWQSINRVNQATFQAGDQILFQGGANFSGNLAFNSQDAGTAASPVTVGSYGTGSATINAGTGTGISILNTQGIAITNLVIAGSGYSTNTGDGINITDNQPSTTLAGITVNQVAVSGFGHVGLHLVGTDGLISGVSITYASVHDNGYGGLAVEARGNHAADLYIGHVQAYHNAGAGTVGSGYGILVLGASNVVVERSVAHDNGWLPGNGGETGGIETIQCERVLLQYNESYANHKGQNDGDGIILDVTTDSVMQYNYAHDNDGAGLFLGAETGYASSNNIVRYNISQNDARMQNLTYAGILVWQNVSNADIYNNTIFMSPSAGGDSAAIRVLKFSGNSVHVRDNLFITTGGVPLVAYNGGGTDLLFQGNDYWSSGSALQFQWLGNSFTSLDATTGWRAATGQEMINGMAAGYEVDPQANNAGGAGTVGNGDLPASLTAAYQLQSTSPLRQAGLDLSRFGVTWDPYGFASDAFFGQAFNPDPKDFSSSILPPAGSGLFSIGAEQITAMPGNLAQLAGFFTHSYEHDADVVQNDYQRYLGRSGSMAEVNIWVSAMQVGTTDEQVLAAFLSAPEYQQRAGSNDRAWVQSLYVSLLGRSAADSEVNGWLQALAGGVSHFQVAWAFATSAERESMVIRADYQRYLGRQASAAEVAGWVNAFERGLTNEQVETAFVCSPEYYYAARKGHGDDAGWISSLYLDILFRAPSDGEVKAWYPALS
jgi:Right handed beta helix region/Domain of unknown function (DUF4214)